MEKRIFVSRFKFSKEYINHLKFLINDSFNCEQDNYKGYYYLYLFSLLACDNDVVVTRGHLPTMIITNNESVDGQEEILDYKKIAIILNLRSISEAKDFCDKLMLCFEAKSKKQKLAAVKVLYDYVLDCDGGFEIGSFRGKRTLK